MARKQSLIILLLLLMSDKLNDGIDSIYQKVITAVKQLLLAACNGIICVVFAQDWSMGGHKLVICNKTILYEVKTASKVLVVFPVIVNSSGLDFKPTGHGPKYKVQRCSHCGTALHK